MCVHTVPTPVHQLPPRLHPSADGRFHGWLPVLIFLMHFCLGLLASEMALSPGVYSCFLMLWPVPAPWSALELCPQTSLLFSSAPLCGLLNVSMSYSQPPPPHCCWKQSLSFLRPNPLQASSDLYARKYTTTVSLSHLLVFFARPGSRKQPEHHLPQGPNWSRKQEGPPECRCQRRRHERRGLGHRVRTPERGMAATPVFFVEESGGLWSAGSQRVGHDLSNLAHIKHGIYSPLFLRQIRLS